MSVPHHIKVVKRLRAHCIQETGSVTSRWNFCSVALCSAVTSSFICQLWFCYCLTDQPSLFCWCQWSTTNSRSFCAVLCCIVSCHSFTRTILDSLRLSRRYCRFLLKVCSYCWLYFTSGQLCECCWNVRFKQLLQLRKTWVCCNVLDA